jgi:hypothetical protein
MTNTGHIDPMKYTSYVEMRMLMAKYIVHISLYVDRHRCLYGTFRVQTQNDPNAHD